MNMYVSILEGNRDLVSALKLAKNLEKHEERLGISVKVIVKNYDGGYQREQGEPDYFSFDKALLNNGALDPERLPRYKGDGCNQVEVTVEEGAEKTEYAFLYSDNQESRVYLDEVQEFLFLYQPMALALPREVA